MSLRRVATIFRLGWIIAWLAMSTAAFASEYRGQVTFGGLPVPGSTVTVTATQGGKKVVAVTDDQGRYYFPDLADGTWTIEISMTGFAPIKQDIAVAPNTPIGTFELKLMSLDEMRAAVKPMKAQDLPALASVVPATTLTTQPNTPAAGGKTAANGKGGATSAKGASGNTQVAANAAPEAPAPPPAQDPTAAQANDGFLINGSVNNAATSQYSLNQAFGNSRNGGRSLYNGNVVLRLDNSALNAAPFSVTGVPAVKPQRTDYTLGLNFGGPLKIPHLMPRGPYFGLNYSRTDNSAISTTPAKIPTGQDSSGNWNLSGLPNITTINVPSDLATVNSACNNYLLGTGLTQTQINSGTAVFPNNTIPAACVASSSKVLLGLYPQTPNLSGNTLGYNYQLPLTSSTHSDNVGISLQRQFGNKNNVNGRFNFQTNRVSTPSIFGFLDKQDQLGMNTGVNWNHRFTQRLSGNLGYNFSRQRGQTIPFFANRNNIQQSAGIAGASTDPRYWGPPSLSFASSITGLSDGISSYNRSEQNAVSVNFYWNKFRHNLQFGGDFKRQEYNYLTQSNPYGSLGFTGAATRSSAGAGGSDQADFLLGIPDTSNIAYGNADKYLRQSLYDAFIDDDFRVNPEFSIHAGLRWEYGSPITELKGRLVNLDITKGFAAEAPVLGSSPTGPLTGNKYPSSLVHADYSRPEPRIGIAWRPISGSSLLVRSGYDVTNDTSVYQSAAYAMATQFPLSKSLSIANSPLCAFNIASPFSAPLCSTTSPDTFAFDPNYRVGYVQTWNLSVQRDLPYSLQMVATYTGTKGTRGVQEILPNTCPPSASGQPTACTTATSGYRFRTSGGNLTREAGSMELRRRLRNGFQARLLYTFSKSLDDDYSLGAQGSVTSGQIAQDWQHPEDQRALSTSDQRHVLNVTAQYTTGMGLGGKTMLSGWRGAIYKEWTIQTAITAASGMPLTPIYAGAIASGTGVTGTVRPNLVGSPFANVQPGYYLNPAAYAVPVGAWGNVRRDSIPGPYQFSMSGTMNRTFRLHDRYTLDAQLNANNVLNHVVITGYNTAWIPGSPTFGAPSSANSMRSVSIQLRMRF
jgi:trimeric autotransporter adhesin